MWLYNAAALAERFWVIAVDTMGGPGKSIPGAGYNKAFDDAEWIDETLAPLTTGEFFAAGVSNGAYLAQYYALHRPGRVKKIVCMAGSVPVGDFGSMKTMLRVFMPEAAFPTRGNAIRLLRKLSGGNSAAFTGNPLVVEHYQGLLRGFHNMAMRFHKMPLFSAEDIGQIRDKVLYLVGEEDPFAKLGGKQALLKNKMQVRFFPGVGHGINHEIADEINVVLIAYFLGQQG